jgi:RNA polymerase sigma-70 factor (ECF subfamily)
MGKRIARAKRKIATARIPYEVPADEELPDRVRGVLRVLYLIFNEGYSATEGDRLVREELCHEAIRLGLLLRELMPDDAEVWGLFALMLLHDSRRVARVDEHGRYLAIGEQDRSQWDQVRIRDGLRALDVPCVCGASGVQGLDSFKAFVAGAEDRHEQPAAFTQPGLIGDYRTFDE